MQRLGGYPSSRSAFATPENTFKSGRSAVCFGSRVAEETALLNESSRIRIGGAYLVFVYMKRLAMRHVHPMDAVTAACVLPWHLLTTDDRAISECMGLRSAMCAREVRMHLADDAEEGLQALHRMTNDICIC